MKLSMQTVKNFFKKRTTKSEHDSVIQIWFADFFKKISGLVSSVIASMSSTSDSWRKTIAALSCVCVLLGLAAIIAASLSPQPLKADGEQKTPIPIENLYLPDEPGTLSGARPIRQPHASWSQADAEQWFIDLTPEEKESLRKLYTQEIENILNEVP